MLNSNTSPVYMQCLLTPTQRLLPSALVFFLMFIYLLLRERKRENKQGGAESKGGTESEADSRLWAVSTESNMGLELMNHEIHDLSWSWKLNWLSHPGAPQGLLIETWILSSWLCCIKSFKALGTHQPQFFYLLNS